MELSRRALSVLCAVVELHIRSGEPIASREVARHSGLGLSPATMRSVMAELEEGGYLCRAHTSAGRVPSDRGFRHYVDTMPRPTGPTPAMKRHLEERMANMRRELVEDFEWVAQLVAEATSEAGVAVRPMGDGPVLEAISLVLLDSNRVLGVIVTDDGSVEKRVLELDGDRAREELQTLSNFLTSHLAGLSIRDIEARIDSLNLVESGSGSQELRVEAQAIARQLFSTDGRDVEVWVAGTDNLLATSDFVDIERVRSLLATLQDRARIATEFRKAFAHGRTQVLIGEESEATASGSLGMVATLYFRDRRRAGAVGVVGPRRMDYQRIVPVVEYVGDTLTQMLEHLERMMPEDKDFPIDAGQPEEDIEIEFLDQEVDDQEVVGQETTQEPEGLIEVRDDSVEQEAEHLKAELDHVRDIYLRKLAEFDNFRKRVEKEREEHRQAGAEEMVRDLLPVLDNFERALQHAEDDSGAFHQGVEMIAKQLWDTLERRGVQEVNPVGLPFDPELHEAVQRVEDGQHPPGTVAWVMLKGYTMGSRLVRPAMVGVAVEPDGDSNNQGGGS